MKVSVAKNRFDQNSPGVFSLRIIKRLSLLLLFVFAYTLLPLSVSDVNAQNKKTKPKPRPIVVQAVIVDGDTMVLSYLKPFVLLSPKVFKSKKEERRYTRLAYKVKKVYPYAKIAGIKFRKYEEILKDVESDKERRKIMKKLEKELEDEFGDELKKLRYSEGVILFKLLDREVGMSSYDIVADLRGKFRAFFYQGLGKLFGYDLKIKYDPLGRDRDIEDIVIRIENGQL